MFEKSTDDNDEEEGVPFKKCLHCARNVLMSKIISSDKDLMGVIFFGTRESKNSSDFPNIYNYQEIDMPDADRILQTEKLESEEGIASFADDFGHADSFELSDALW